MQGAVPRGAFGTVPADVFRPSEPRPAGERGRGGRRRRGAEGAVVGFAVSDRLEIVFDTVETTRKYKNPRADPRIALVIGWDDEITAQIEGVADFPTGDELERVRECYFTAYPDGRDRLAWPGSTHVRLRPTWIRYSDFTKDPPHIVELVGNQLG